MGMLVFHRGEPMVLEAIQPVSITPLQQWTARGVNGHYVVKRLADAETRLTPEVQTRMLQEAELHLNKPYDIHFEWSDDKMYCSELVYKVYERSTGIKIGDLNRLDSFDLAHPAVQRKLKERYGGHVPVGETVISPQSMFESPNLVLVLDASVPAD